MKKIKTLISLICVLGILLSTSVTYAASISIAPVGESAVFEEGETIECVITYGQAGSLRVNVNDYFGKNVFSKSLGYVVGSGSKTVTITGLGTGWYDVIVNQGYGGTAASTQIAVVPATADRYTGETPFATDMAANHIVSDSDTAGKYSGFAKKAGLNWVRERYYWWLDSSNFAPVIEKENGAGLDVVAVSAEYTTGGYATQEDMFTDDLFKVYNYQKDLTSEMGNKVDVWEIWNEMDHENFLKIPADMYSPFFKAAAIAVKDSGADAKVMFGGLCIYPDENDFAKMMVENDVLRYSDIYNIHRHMPVNSTETQKFDTEMIKKHQALMRTSGYERPLWVTEAGLAMSGLTSTIQKKQARYTVTSMVESIAAGTDKHFWFILPRFLEGGKYEYGAFNENGNPRPAYSSLAVLTDILGKAEYKGTYNSSDINGYVFNNGTKDVLVAWSNTSTTLAFNQSYKVYNIMGNEITSLSVGPDPVYVVFDTPLSSLSYIAAEKVDAEMAAPLTQKDRIVVQADFNAMEDAVKIRENGYSIGDLEERIVTVKVYNFNDTAVSGTLNCEAEGFVVGGNAQKIEIPAKGSASYRVTIAPDTMKTGDTGYVSFSVTTNEGKTSPTIAKVNVCESARIVPSKQAPARAYGGSYFLDYWLYFYNNNLQNTPWVEYDVYVEETGVYSLKFASGGTTRVKVIVNGSECSYKTGGVATELAYDTQKNWATWYECENVVPMYAGKNTVRIECIPGKYYNNTHWHAGVTEVLMTKMGDVPVTATTARAMSNPTTNLSGVGYDPWAYINVAQEDVPYIKWNYSVPDSGYYKVRMAYSGSSKAMVKIGGHSVSFEEATNLGTYCLPQFLQKNAPWCEADDVIYLDKGEYEVTMELIPGYYNSAGNWRFSFAGFALAEVERKIDNLAVSAEKSGSDIMVVYEAPEGTDFDIIASEYEGEMMKKMLTPLSVKGANDSGLYRIPAGNTTKIYIWDSISGMKPLLDSIEVK